MKIMITKSVDLVSYFFMKIGKLYLVTIIIFFAIGIKTEAKNDETGIRIYLNYGLHTASFKELPGIPNCCPRFETANAFTYEASAYYHFPIDSNFFYGFNLSYKWLGGDFSADETTTLNYNENLITGNFRHELRIDLRGIGFGGDFGYKLFNRLNLNIGLWGAYFFSNSYHQREVITKPEDAGTFLDSLGRDTGKRTRNEFSGDLPLDIAFQAGLTGLISYDLPLSRNGKYNLEPFIAFDYPINELSTDLDWRYNSFKFGLSFNYKLMNEDKPSIHRPLKDSLQVPEIKDFPVEDKKSSFKYPEFQRSLWKDTIFNLVKLPKPENVNDKYIEGKVTFDFDTIETYKKRVIREYRVRTDTVEYGDDRARFVKLSLYNHETGEKIHTNLEAYENISINAVPILNYIFFKKDAFDITQYHDPIITEYGRRGLEFYHSTLDSIGKRLEKYGGNLLLLAPFVVGTDNDSSSATKRIETIKNYLTHNYNLSPSKFNSKIYSVQLSTDDKLSAMKMDELRRVELYPENENVLKPIYFSDRILLLKPSDIDIKLDAVGVKNTQKWNITIWQDGYLLKKIEGTGAIPDKYRWQNDDDYEFAIRELDPLVFITQITDNNGNFVTDTARYILKDIALSNFKNTETGEIKTPRKDYYNILVFDLNSADISDFNRSIIRELEKNIKQGCVVKVIGFTDNTGNPEYNKKLSFRRAQNAANLIEYPNVEVIGYGNSTAFDNSMPEGRFMNRSVVIMVQFP